jgi:hypothetical protein
MRRVARKVTVPGKELYIDPDLLIAMETRTDIGLIG